MHLCAGMVLLLQELFLQELAVRSHAAMQADSSRKGLDYKDVGEAAAATPDKPTAQSGHRPQAAGPQQPLTCLPPSIPQALQRGAPAVLQPFFG